MRLPKQINLRRKGEIGQNFQELPLAEEQCLARLPAYPHDDQVVVAKAGLPQDRILWRDIEA